jgi:hypothetical protein
MQSPAIAPVKPDPNVKKPVRKKLGARKKAEPQASSRRPWQPWEQNIAVSAAIRGLADDSCSPELLSEIHSLASAILNCGKPEPRIFRGAVRELPLRSGRHILCSRCAWIRAQKLARAAAARVVLAYESDPTLHFGWITLTMPEMSDLGDQLDLAFTAIDGLRRSVRDGEPLLEGFNWHIEIERRRFDTWRAHVHGIGAVRHGGWETEKAILLRWIELTRPNLSEPERLKALEGQHMDSLWAHGTPGLSGTELLLELGRDAFGTTRYAAKPLRLSTSDRLYAFGVVHGRHLSDCFGVFRGKKPEVRADALARIGGAPLLERTHTDIPAPRHHLDRHARKLVQRREWLTRVRTDGRLPKTKVLSRSATVIRGHRISKDGRPSLKHRSRASWSHRASEPSPVSPAEVRREKIRSALSRLHRLAADELADD